jgi:hypothetical protein
MSDANVSRLDIPCRCQSCLAMSATEERLDCGVGKDRRSQRELGL